MHQNTKVTTKLNRSLKIWHCLYVWEQHCWGPKPTDGGEQRELCGRGQVRGEEGGGGRGLGTTVAITAILFHRLSFIKPDKLLKELLSDCCWYVARKQPSMSVSESITLLSCASEEEGKQIGATKSCSGGGSSRWQSWLPSYEQPEGSSVVYHKPSAPLSPSVQTQIRHCYYTDSAG